jgi:hypothetical protein
VVGADEGEGAEKGVVAAVDGPPICTLPKKRKRGSRAVSSNLCSQFYSQALARVRESSTQKGSKGGP